LGCCQAFCASSKFIDLDGTETLETSNEPYEGISYFTTENYELECCMDYALAEGMFTLVFDEAPDFDGEPVEVGEETEGEDNEVGNQYLYVKSA